ncbi:hypothetical protein NDU88_006198 [Pleurodeles waltl]|uniref:Uncharacterized protein n=1 Tax=Pleurodeles waltl TaxID=8319 RepID=A0AAV7WDQ1_PLEWA|nr:hypothetical protein NDU88_006198 [Pleurodeles waltl]
MAEKRCLEDTSGEYVEEEQMSYFPIDDNFCHIMDASIYKVVTQLMAPLEKKIDLMASQCSLSLPAEDSAGPSNFNSLGRAGSPGPTRKHAGEDALEAFARLKKACIEQPHDPDSLGDKLSHSPRSLDADLDPEGPILTAKDPAAEEIHTDTDDMLNPDDLVHPRLAEWLPVGNFEVGVKYFDLDSGRRKKEEGRTRVGPFRRWSTANWLKRKSVIDVVSYFSDVYWEK